MKYKSIILDIDNTLYDYNIPHKIALQKVLDFCHDKFDIDKNLLLKFYNKARKEIHVELENTASSHNRLLYFQRMCELVDVNPLNYSFLIYNLYWDTFLENIIPFKNIYKLLEKYKKKICLLTDLTADIQFRKTKKLKLNIYCNKIVTSEEAGIEKPNPHMFILALNKLNLKESDVCMIGDNFSKDIIGARNLNIDAIWFNHEENNESYNDNQIAEVRTINEILNLI